MTHLLKSLIELINQIDPDPTDYIMIILVSFNVYLMFKLKRVEKYSMGTLVEILKKDFHEDK